MIKTSYNYKDIWLIAYPILISLLMEQLIGMTDTAFLGRVGEIELGASAIAGVYFLAIFMIAFGFGVGVQILIGRRNGSRNYQAIGSIFYQGIYFMGGLALILFILSQIFSPIVLKSIISSPQICEAAQGYLQWRVFGFFFAFGGIMFRSFFVGTTLTKTLTLNSIVMVVSNVIFNYILIFGKFGFPALGIEGAAIGSSLAELISLLFFIIHTRRHIDYRKYNLHIIPKFRSKVLKKILGLSGWVMIQNFLSLSSWFLFFLFIEHLGERPLAIANIVRNVSGILFMIMIAFASTCGTLTSNLIGAGYDKEVLPTIQKSVNITFAILIPIIIVFCIFPETIISIYTDIADLRTATVPSFWVLCVAYLALIPANIYFQSVSGTGNTRMAFKMEACVLFIYIIFITYIILYLRLDVAIAWTSEILWGSLMFLFSYLYMKSGRWKRKKI